MVKTSEKDNIFYVTVELDGIEYNYEYDVKPNVEPVPEDVARSFRKHLVEVSEHKARIAHGCPRRIVG